MTLELSADEALVLFEFLSRWDTSHVFEIIDQDEQRVLWNVHAALEKKLTEPFSSEYPSLILAARARLSDPV